MLSTYFEKFLMQEYAVERGGKTKRIWEWIKDRQLTACPAFIGNKYHESALRLMVVGRAVNGWEVAADQCVSAETALNVILQQKDRFEDVVKAEGIPYVDHQTNENKVYYYRNSRFWRLIQYVLEEAGEKEDFHQRIVWSNLYKVAPYVTGNPAWRLVKPNMQAYIDCLIEEIRTYKPTHILFITGMDYLNPWAKEPQFGAQLGIGKPNQIHFMDRPYESGIFEKAKIVVCSRPEGKSYESIRTMAKEILHAFEKLD